MVDLPCLLKNIRACRACEEDLPFGANPVVQASETAKIVIAGQAPGLAVHKSGVPFDDPSGDRLRHWMGVGKDVFYNDALINIIPMGFCYPGSMSKGGDKPPHPHCRELWHDKIFALKKPELILVIGAYAINYHIAQKIHSKKTIAVTEAVKNWRNYGPVVIPLPHPSPRNIFWFKRNPWFEEELLPDLKQRLSMALQKS